VKEKLLEVEQREREREREMLPIGIVQMASVGVELGYNIGQIETPHFLCFPPPPSLLGSPASQLLRHQKPLSPLQPDPHQQMPH